MKKPHVLNRPMFNTGGTSAYGKGITSNLVSDEQRQRFNYGGRVGYQNRGLVNPYVNENEWYNYDKEPWNTIERTIPIKSDPYSTASSQTEDDILNEWGPLVEGVEVEDLFPSLGSGRKKVAKDKAAQERFESAQERMNPTEILEAKVEEEIPPPLPTDTDSDVLGAGTDWKKFAEGLYDKKKTLGEAQFGAAGTILAASQLPKKEAAMLLGKGMGDFGKTIGGRRTKMEDIAATGKMYETIYKTREEEKGKQTRLTALNKTKTGNPWTDYQAALLSLKDKDDAIDFATGETVRTLTIDTKTKEVEMPSDGIPGQLFKHPTTKEYFLIDKDGKPQPINLNKYLKNLKLA